MPMVVPPLRELPTLAILVFLARTSKSLVHFSRLWQIAQRLCGRWHIAAVTARYANVLEVKSWQNPPALENQFYIDGRSISNIIYLYFMFVKI
jgi:hypothetical protein